MKICKTLALPLGSVLLASAASAQIVYGTSNSTGDDNFLLNVGSTVSTGPVFTGARTYGLADDDANQLIYSSEESMISSAPYSGPAAATFVIAPVDAAGASIRSEGLVFNAGMLFALSEVGQGAAEGIYSVDLVTGLGTEELIYANPTEVSIGGIDVDPGTGLFYGASDDSDTRGINVIDIVADTTAVVSPYPAGIFDVDGLAFNPNGTVYLVQDEAQPIDVYDLATSAYTGTLPTAVGLSNTFSGATFSALLSGPIVSVGTNYCVAVPNSTGAMGTMSGSGSATAADNNLTITASSLPLNQFGIFLTSTTQAFVPTANGTSNGNLCLGGAIGRYTTAAQILSTGPTGEFSLVINLTAVPEGNGTVPVLAGVTRNFQAWTRDAVGVGSNFSDGLQVDFN